MILSACGLICNECEYFGNKCDGCIAVNGSTFWAKEMMPSKVCPMYDCSVNKKGFKNCGSCSELPCSIFLGMKDPNSTDEEHRKSISERVLRLKAN